MGNQDDEILTVDEVAAFLKAGNGRFTGSPQMGRYRLSSWVELGGSEEQI